MTAEGLDCGLIRSRCGIVRVQRLAEGALRGRRTHCPFDCELPEVNAPIPRLKDRKAWLRQFVKVVNDPAASDWLNDALMEAVDREPLEAEQDPTGN
jgi:hypothetical protein